MSPRTLLSAAALALALTVAVPAAQATDPGRWKLVQADVIPIEYFQGLTHDPGSGEYWVGPSDGVYRTDRTLRESGRNTAPYPADVTALGFNHIGDPTFDSGQGGRLLAPMECYHPGGTGPANTCGVGGFGVIDPATLAWRYWVRLDQADIPKAMWAEVSPDGKLVWTSSGNDLLAYRTADIVVANAASGLDSPPIHPVKRLPGAVPPSGVTGAVFVKGRLFLAGDVDGLLQVVSVDVSGATPNRTEIELPGIKRESEGLDLVDMRGGMLHWTSSPFVDNPSFDPFKNEMLTFLPTADARLRVAAHRVKRDLVVAVTTRYSGYVHAVNGAVVRVGSRRAQTSASGRVRLKNVPRSRLRVSATKSPLARGTATVAKKKR